MKITQMPDLLANKIAAGEVVERPASVVKELVENSIDAGSTWIKIELKEAGLEQIREIDNGEGMTASDCEKAFLRHATSKIKNENDLFHVRTLGFRGEALASIASVSRLVVQSSLGEEAGTQLILEGGKVTAKNKSNARKGTEIVVSDLFFNTPARLKYMKTIHTELGHITDLLNRLALSHSDIRFEVMHNDKPLFKTTGTGDPLQVIANIYGMNIARKMLPIQEENLDFKLSGFIAKPEVTRASRSYITTVINGRYIKSIPLNQAIIRAYHTLLPIGRYPIVVIAIQMDPILVDVNVHPTKLEVRFSKEKELSNLVESTIKETFRKTSLIPEMEHTNNRPKQSEQETLPLNSNYRPSFDLSADKHTIYERKTIEDTPNFESTYHRGIPDKDTSSSSRPTLAEEKQEQPIHDEITANSVQRVPIMYPIGQLHGTYIMAQNEHGLYMIDQHAAQERIKYEFFKEKLGKTINQSQELLIPLTFEFSKKEAIFIEKYKEELERAGLFLESFGSQTYIVRSCPTWFPKGLEEEIIRDMVEQIIRENKINVELIREEVAILMSCKRSIKANHYLNYDDMFKLLEDLRQTTDPFTCPHGRPVIIHFTSYELEKMFKRVM